MELAVNELKIQAKKRLKHLRCDNQEFALFQKKHKLTLDGNDELQLKHVLLASARELGFASWQLLVNVLSGQSTAEQLDMGTLFYPRGCHGLTNEWFASYHEAQQVLAQDSENKWLLPYKTQFMVVTRNYMAAFNLPLEAINWLDDVKRDMAGCYNSLQWDNIVVSILRHRQ
ncbi:MAG: hypothetical protein ACPG8A_10815 [Psychrobium sp.]